MSRSSVKLRCPACSARVATEACHRCGADLRPLHRVHEEGRRCCRAARAALQRGDVAMAQAMAMRAFHYHATDEAQRLVTLLRILRA